MLTVKDIENYHNTQLLLDDRCIIVFEMYKASGCLVDHDIIYTGFDVDGILKYVDIYYEIPHKEEDTNTCTFVLSLPFKIVVSNELIEEDIKKRLEKMKPTPSDFPFKEGTKVYIAGKMTGLEVEEIMRRFNSAEKFLIDKGYAVMNPAVLWNLGDPSGFNNDEYLEINFAMIDLCDVLVVLPGFEGSYGTTKEIEHAMSYNIPVYYLDEEYNFYTR